MRPSIDLNADLGEGFGNSRLTEDTALLDFVSSANVACGFHAGDEMTMRDTVRAAKLRGVSIGAHPSYPDLPGFGRRELAIKPVDIHRHVLSQVGTLAEICRSEKIRLLYVKPHGAMYNRAATDDKAAAAIVTAIRDADRSLVLLGLGGSAMERAARAKDLQFAREAFVDRAYRRDGTLVPRSESGAVIHDPDFAARRALRLVADGKLEAIDGNDLTIDADSLCVHGDNPDAAKLISILRSELESAGVVIAAFTK